MRSRKYFLVSKLFSASECTVYFCAVHFIFFVLQIHNHKRLDKIPEMCYNENKLFFQYFI